ncbi:transcription factor TFIIIB subunit brf1, partial [Cladochytrium tenue]
VAEENAIVNEITFTESAGGAAGVDGITVSKDRGGQGRRARRPSESGFEDGHRRIRAVGTQMRLGEVHVEQASRYFNIAVVEGFTKGRKAVYVTAACLYISCRLNKTPHMLLDFSERLRTNIFVLGATFVKLVATLKLTNIPMVDPVLYLPKFASRLDFVAESGQDCTNVVVQSATKLAARMERDWIVKGRPPGGVCAASLFIAARMNGFSRSIKEIVHVVKICENTLRARLAEFSKTPSSNLSVEDFEVVNLEEAADPPSFERHHGVDATAKRATIAAGSATAAGEKDTGGRGGDGRRGEGGGDCDEFDEFERQLTEQVRTHLQKAEASEFPASPVSAFGFSSNTRVRRRPTVGYSVEELDDNLSYLEDDVEVRNALLTEQEHEFKKRVWETMYQDWELVKGAQEAANAHHRPAKRTRRRRDADEGGATGNGASGAGGEPSARKLLSKKINYSFVQNL